MLRNCRLCGAVVVVASLALVSGCGDDNKSPTTPTPAPAPAPAPAPTPTPPPAPAAPAALESIALSAAEVPSQGQPTLTVRLTAAAPSGGASITLNSNSDSVKVPSNISIAAGETSNSLTIDTATVNVKTTATITATYQGVNMAAALTVLPPPLVPRFTVVSQSVGSDACAIVTSGGAVDCRLDGSPSGGFPSSYIWTLSVPGGGSVQISSPSPGPFTPATTCGLLAGGTQSDGKVAFSISLVLEDRQGNRSNNTEQRTVPLVTNRFCGY
ncbi:MAG TPA: hypothetical protein VH436_02830 [Vicinamibacterales bacterium]